MWTLSPYMRYVPTSMGKFQPHMYALYFGIIFSEVLQAAVLMYSLSRQAKGRSLPTGLMLVSEHLALMSSCETGIGLVSFGFFSFRVFRTICFYNNAAFPVTKRGYSAVYSITEGHISVSTPVDPYFAAISTHLDEHHVIIMNARCHNILVHRGTTTAHVACVG